MNKINQVLKMEIEGIKKLQKETTLEIQNLGKRSGVTDQASPTEHRARRAVHSSLGREKANLFFMCMWWNCRWL